MYIFRPLVALLTTRSIVWLGGLALFLSTFHIAEAVKAAETIKGIAIVVDGDHIRVAGRDVRLYAIDAPEIGQTCTHADGAKWSCGLAARDLLEQLIDRHPVECIVMSKGQHGQIVGLCNANGVALGASSVAHGLAMALRKYSEAYDGLEKQAQSKGAGIWSGTFEVPEAYRSRTEPRHQISKPTQMLGGPVVQQPK